MEYKVSVILKGGAQYTYNLGADEVAAFDPSSAYEWIGDAFEEADLDPPSMSGKILLTDQILMLANEQKSGDWAAPPKDLRKFLAAVITSLKRPTVTIDLANYKV